MYDAKLSTVLFNKTRRKLLALLYGHADRTFYVNQILQSLGGGSGAVQRELRLMTEAGLLKRTESGNMVYYQANGACPIYDELKTIVRRTFGVADVISRPKMLMDDTASATGRLDQRFKTNRRKLREFCRLNGIQSLSVFGSILRDDFKPESDIDVLVEFLPGKSPGFLKLAEMENRLSVLMGGRSVDLRTPQDLSRHFRDRVLREAQPLCR